MIYVILKLIIAGQKFSILLKGHFIIYTNQFSICMGYGCMTIDTGCFFVRVIHFSVHVLWHYGADVSMCSYSVILKYGDIFTTS